uniref:Uncharacterized protein n=1 Tax=Tetranychus urticae TaxID=32264 RepID=T1JVR2_TETUR
MIIRNSVKKACIKRIPPECSEESNSQDESLGYEANKREGTKDKGATSKRQIDNDKQAVKGNKFLIKRPLKASSNIRPTVRRDYQLDICKD